MIRLEVQSGEAKGLAYGCGQPDEGDAALGEFLVGRGEHCQLVLPVHHVSGEHLAVAYVGDGYVVRDLNSTNGTRLIRAGTTSDLSSLPDRETRLQDGDVLQLGDVEADLRVAVHVGEEDDDTRIVSMRRVTELGQVEAEVSADRELLRGLYEAQRLIGAAIAIDDVLDAVAVQVFRFLPRATHVTVALREEDESGASRSTARYVPVGTRLRDAERPVEAVPITRSVFRKVVKERAAVLAADAKKDVGETASLMAAEIQSTIGIPLWKGDALIGVLQVDNRASSGIFKPRDLDVLAVLAQTTSQAFDHARLVQRLRVAEEKARNENDYLKRRDPARKFGGIIGESRAMQKVFDHLRKVVDTRVTILIEGETGTGKELIASAAHYWSNRRDRLFVAQNCAAVPENLLESELFGHKKGAFTGATDEKKGLFELADKGTLFLDEVGEMPLPLQAKLLRVLQEGEVRPVGANHPKFVDVRIVAATNRDLEKEVAEGRFREDLYYRLKVFPLRVPPLRERREDVPLLANFFLQRYVKEFGREVEGFSQAAMERMAAYQWPGNVRELENEVQRLVIQVDDGDFILPEHLSPKLRESDAVSAPSVSGATGTLRQIMDQVERALLVEKLAEHGNNKTATAKTLGITREGLHKKLKNHGIG